MRILRTTLMGLLALGLLGVQSSVSAALITGVTINDSSAPSFGRDPENTIGGTTTGLSGTGAGTVFGAGVHSVGNPSADEFLSAGATNRAITFNLGANYDLDGIHVWNSNEATSVTGRGFNSVVISVSPTTSTGGLVSIGTFTFDEASGLSTEAGQFIDLSGIVLADDARLVRFLGVTNYGDPDFSGLAEVQFNAIPEPSSLLLVGLGMVGLVGYRRRRS